MLTRKEITTRAQEIRDRITEIRSKHRPSRDDQIELAAMTDELQELQTAKNELDRAAMVEAAMGRGGGGLRFEGEHNALGGRDNASARGGRHDSAMRTLERSVKDGLASRAAEVVEKLLGSGGELERSWTQRWVTESGSAEYRSAFAKLLMHGEQRASLEFTAGEHEAFNRVGKLAAEQRAMSLTSSSGGYMVPFELDPSIAIVNAGSTSPLLQISRLTSTSTDAWHGVSSAGVQASWDAEATEVSDDSPALAEPTVNAYKAAAFVPFSIELQGDAIGLLDELGKLIADGHLQLLNAALATGSGVGCPTGIVTALTGTSSVVATGTGGALAPADVYALQNSLGPRWQANARWIGNLAVFNALRQAESANGSLLFPELRSSTPSLLGRPVHECSGMDNTIAAGKHLAIYGDFSQYLITQRVGSTVELVPHLFSPANNRPTGQRGLYSWSRWGADSINDSAFRMLQA